MYASKVLFASLSLLAGLVAADDFCCEDKLIADPSDTCSGNAFCCDKNSNADIGRGCDKDKEFPTGKSIVEFSSFGCKTSSGASGTISYCYPMMGPYRRIFTMSTGKTDGAEMVGGGMQAS
ncbi:hypothetical protein LZ32DRAFT_672845 [Colletotrichum eremochloae]|nr:hypothetical protein LZ32DRAFT_672845 [Colletotrichum eremochloae]